MTQPTQQFTMPTLIVLALMATSVLADNLSTLYDTFRPMICRVQYYKNVSTQSEIGTYLKIEQQRIGILTSPDGLVMVNSAVYPLSLDIISSESASYVSGEPTDFKVILHDGRELEADFLGKDEQAQVGFVQIKNVPSNPLPFVTFDDSDSVRVGQQVFLLELLGEEYNFEPLFTPLHINAVVDRSGRKYLIKNQVTALSACGLVISANGKAIGVTQRSTPHGGFLIGDDFPDIYHDYLRITPSERLRPLIADPPVLQRTTSSVNAWLGIGMQALTVALADYWKIDATGGIVIDRIYPESPADKSGLKTRDVITKVNGSELNINRDEDLSQMREIINSYSPGTKLQLDIFRNGKQKQIDLTLDPAPRSIDLAEKIQFAKLGIEVRELTHDVLYDYVLPLSTRGVYVYQVDQASPAGIAGLEVGSIVTHLNSETISNLKEFESHILASLEDPESMIMVQAQIRSSTHFVFLKLD